MTLSSGLKVLLALENRVVDKANTIKQSQNKLDQLYNIYRYMYMYVFS